MNWGQGAPAAGAGLSQLPAGALPWRLCVHRALRMAQGVREAVEEELLLPLRCQCWPVTMWQAVRVERQQLLKQLDSLGRRVSKP